MVKQGLLVEHNRAPSNGLAFSCRERAAQISIKKGAILRAKRSTATPCSAAAVLLYPDTFSSFTVSVYGMYLRHLILSAHLLFFK
jgi:hypothetical protein